MKTSLYEAAHRPWYLRTIPGRTGAFLGHAIAGILIGLLGLALLLLALYRARTLPAGKSFTELHIPERDHRFLKWLGLLITVFVPIGMIYDIVDKEEGYDPTALVHCTIYACFFVVGVCALYEAKGRLPADSHRAAMVFSFLTQGMIWLNHHGELPADVSLHVLLGYLNFADAAIVAYSMRFTDSIAAFVAGWGVMVMQGMWLVTIGLYECCLNITAGEVIIYFALYCVFIFLSIVLAIVHVGTQPEDPMLAELRGKEFTPLAEDDSEGTHEWSDEEDHKCIA